MKHPTFLEGVAVALIASIGGSILFTTVSPMMENLQLVKLLVAGLGLLYTLYLFSRSRERLGRIVTLSAWCISAAIIWIINPPLTLYLLMHIGLIWLIRSLYFYTSLFSALADLGLSGLSLAAAVWAAVHTGSIFLSIWCFFLLQALFTAIPSDLKKRTSSLVEKNIPPVDRFQQAEQAAEAALRRLSSLN
jgi:hypothetical protein